MAKAVYIGVQNIARKVKKVYIGVNGIARKVKKMYIGVAGIARCIYSGELGYNGYLTPNYGTTTWEYTLTKNRNYMICNEGNRSQDNPYTNVYAYDKNLTKTQIESLAQVRIGTVGGKHPNANLAAFMGGGYYSGSSTYDYRSGYIDMYDTNLSHTYTESTGWKRSGPTPGYVGNYSLFIKGFNGNYYTDENDIVCLNVTTGGAMLVSTTEEAPASVKRPISATNSNNTLCFFAGGVRYSSSTTYYYDKVYTINDNLTISTAAGLATKGLSSSATFVGDYVIIGPGTRRTKAADVYDQYGTKLQVLTFPNSYSVACNINDTALFINMGSSSIGLLIDKNLAQSDISISNTQSSYGDDHIVFNDTLFVSGGKTYYKNDIYIFN